MKPPSDENVQEVAEHVNRAYSEDMDGYENTEENREEDDVDEEPAAEEQEQAEALDLTPNGGYVDPFPVKWQGPRKVRMTERCEYCYRDCGHVVEVSKCNGAVQLYKCRCLDEEWSFRTAAAMAAQIAFTVKHINLKCPHLHPETDVEDAEPYDEEENE